jgi:LacI family transcriptional regulator, galactose operon repressor
MSDVAKKAGVSRTAVSFVLNNVPDASIPDTTRARILQAARELNYIPNVQGLNLARGRTMMIALVIRQTSEQMSADLFMGEFIRGATRVMEAEDYHLLVHASEPEDHHSTYGKLVRTRKVDGLLVSSPLVNDPEVKLLHEEGTPIVLHGALPTSDIPSVDVDNVQGAYSAVRHLIGLGHRRIGHISNAPFSYTSSVDRHTGYCQALEEAHIAYDENLVLGGEFTADSGYVLMRQLLNLPEPPTAVFVGSDVLSIGAVDAIYDRGLTIPNDISVASFDDVLISRYIRPPLTTVHLPAYDLGRRATEMILQIIHRKPLPALRVLLPTELIIRHSTAPVQV